jgi:hypothetical protein
MSQKIEASLNNYIGQKILTYIYDGTHLTQELKDKFKKSLIFLGYEGQIYNPLTNTYIGIGTTAYTNTIKYIDNVNDKVDALNQALTASLVSALYANFNDEELSKLTYYSYNTNDENRQYYQLVGKDLNELIEEALSNYSVTMNDEAWLWEELKPSYKAEETVSVKIAMALDVGYMFFVNGEQIATCNDVDGLYWEFTFTMPECDVEIDFKTYDGFLPDANYGLLIETYWLQNLDAESVSVRRYYGEFDSGAIVAMMHVGHFDDAEWSEVVADITFQYYDSDRITVLYDGVFYTLPEAYQYGFISADDLSVIAELHNGNV